MFVYDIAKHSPDLIKLGPLTIRFYGLVYALGFLWISYLLTDAAKKKRIRNLDRDRATDLLAYGMVGAIIGARLLHVLSELDYYIASPIQILFIWQGGLAFFGGIAGFVIVAWLFCRKNKISMLKILDFLSVPLPLVVFFGRIANFLNGEHWGYPTNLPWAVVFPHVDELPRHPAQIYEAISMLLLYFFMRFASKRTKKRGQTMSLFLIGYGVLRFITEIFRENAKDILGMSISQVISLASIIIGTILFFRFKNKR